MAPDNPMTTPGIIWRSDDLTTPIEGWRGTLEIRAGSAVDSTTGPLAELARLRAENERLRGALDNILARTHDGSSYRMAQDIYQTAIDALVPTAPPAR
jgi:hypothetical protein